MNFNRLFFNAVKRELFSNSFLFSFTQLAIEVRPGQSKRTATTTSSIKTVDKDDFNLPPVPTDIESAITKSAPLDDFLVQVQSDKRCVPVFISFILFFFALVGFNSSGLWKD